MPNPTNDQIVQRHKELRNTLMQKHARLAAEKIVKLKKLPVGEVAKLIADGYATRTMRCRPFGEEFGRSCRGCFLRVLLSPIPPLTN